MDTLASKLHNPYYDIKKDVVKPPNAFLHPNNPQAQFPKVTKQKIYDFRSHKIKNSGYASIGTSRRLLNSNAKKSKYATEVKTAEDLEMEKFYKE